MHRIGIIGLGTIFEQHLQALERVKNLFTLIAVYDIDPNREVYALNLCRGLPGMEDVYGAESIDDFLKIRLDTVLIATPPATHCRIAERCIIAHKNVLLEKPADVNMQNLEHLYLLADKQRCLLHVAFHAAYSAELLWFLQHRSYIEEKYSLGHLRSIECRFSDPYLINGTLISGRENLGGSYIDSTVNELSICYSLVQLPAFQTNLLNTQTLPGFIPPLVVSSLLQLSDEERGLSILCYTDWTNGHNNKISKLLYDNGSIILNHSQQSVVMGESNILFDNSSQARLITQYINLLTDYSRYLEMHSSNREESLAIHRCLFCHQ